MHQIVPSASTSRVRPGPGPPHGAGPLEPLLAAAGGELALGGAVELPRRPGWEGLDQPVLEGRRAGGAGVRDQPEAGQVRPAASRVGRRVPVREQALEVRRHAEHRRRALAADGRGDPLGVEAARGDHPAAGEHRAHREAQRCGVVQRAEDEVHVGVGEAPQVPLLGHQGGGVGFGEQAAVDALRGPGGAAGDVHRAGPGEDGRAEDRGAECGELLLGLHHQVRRQPAQDPVALVGGQSRVERDREDAAPQQGEHRVEVAERPGHEQRDPVALPQGVSAARHGRRTHRNPRCEVLSSTPFPCRAPGR